MRIAMAGHKRIPSREGGIEVVVEELAARMVVHGHAVTCYNRSGHHVSGREYDAEHLDEYRGIRLKHLPTIDRKGLAAVTSSFFGCLAAAFGPYDVVHVHAEGPAMFSWIPRLTGKRVILTIHGLDWARDKWKGSFGSWYIRMGEKTGARCAHEIIVLNHSTQKYFLDTYGRTTHYIPNGVNPAAPVPADIIREKYGLEKDSYILYLGRMVPEKGCHYLVDAFKKLDTDKKLVIAGGSSDTHWYMDELKEQAGGDERVIFTGFVDGQLREELYSNAYLFVLPSDLEGMPLCLLEAMSYGNCVITSDIEECANVIHDNGIVFREGDVDDLAQKLGKLCSVLGLLQAGLLPVQADLGIALAVRNARHAEVHADFAALAVEVGHQLVKDILLVLFGDVRVVLHGLAVNAELVLGSELELTLDLFEHIALGVAHGALRRSLGAFIDITANLAKPLFHNCYLHKVLS